MSIEQHVTQVLDQLERRGRVRRPLVWFVQIGIFLLSGLSAFLLRFDYVVPRARWLTCCWRCPCGWS